MKPRRLGLVLGRGALVVCTLGALASHAAAAAATDSAGSTGRVNARYGSPSSSVAPRIVGPAAPPAWARAYAQGQWSAAIAWIDTVPEASRTVWQWLHLGRALGKRGQLVEAFAAYERLLELTADGADVPGMSDVERLARAESGALAARIPWAEVALGSGLPAGALVFVDQQWLEPARLRSPYPVNPGWHAFLVESNGEVLAARRVFFEEGQSRRVPLNTSADAGAAALPENRAEPGASRGLPPSAQEANADLTPRRRTLTWHPDARLIDGDRPARLLEASYASLAVGLLGTALGTGLAVAAANTGDRSGAGAATASFAVGVGALVTGGVFWLLYRDASRTQVSIANIEFAPQLSARGAAVRGSF